MPEESKETKKDADAVFLEFMENNAKLFKSGLVLDPSSRKFKQLLNTLKR